MFLLIIWQDSLSYISVEDVGNNDMFSDKQVTKIPVCSSFWQISLLYNEPCEIQFYKQKYQFTIKHD